MKNFYLLLTFLSLTTIAIGQLRMGALTLNEAIDIAHAKSPRSQIHS